MTKIEAARQEYKDWCSAIGIDTLEKVNEVVDSGNAIELINLCEARQERKYAEAADQIFWRRKSCGIVMMSGPSSSGKTSSSLRIAQQCRVLGITPKVIELDNYFKPREETPKDENGEYDFEALGAMNVDLLNENLNDLLAGREVIIPKFDFKEGRSIMDPSRTMRLESNDILFMEGIHALNPALTEQIPDSAKFRIFINTLTGTLLDDHNMIPTSDNRLLRRIVRDYNKGAFTARESISNWQNVLDAEQKWIYPYQEMSDVMFNSAYLIEFAVLKNHAEPILRSVPQNCAEYSEAHRLLKFIHYFTPVPDKEIPATSLLREFIGG